MSPEAVGLQEAYICGPAAFMTDTTKNLVALGISAPKVLSFSNPSAWVFRCSMKKM